MGAEQKAGSRELWDWPRGKTNGYVKSGEMLNLMQMAGADITLYIYVTSKLFVNSAGVCGL